MGGGAAACGVDGGCVGAGVGAVAGAAADAAWEAGVHFCRDCEVSDFFCRGCFSLEMVFVMICVSLLIYFMV